MKSLDVYVDGSYTETEIALPEWAADGKYSNLIGRQGTCVHGGIVILDKETQEPLTFCTVHCMVPTLVAAWSQGGEVIAAVAASQLCRAKLEVAGELSANITIYHDNMGISEWIKPHGPKKWKANSACAKFYVDAMNSIYSVNPYSLNFVKVKGHSGILYNDVADALAASESHPAITKPVEVIKI